jgi:hypothetical protein
VCYRLVSLLRIPGTLVCTTVPGALLSGRVTGAAGWGVGVVARSLDAALGRWMRVPYLGIA